MRRPPDSVCLIRSYCCYDRQLARIWKVYLQRRLVLDVSSGSTRARARLLMQARVEAGEDGFGGLVGQNLL
jgi:hypothetical protein